MILLLCKYFYSSYFLLQEIHATHTKVLKSLGEAEQAKQSFLDLRTQAENLLSQLQEQVKTKLGLKWSVWKQLVPTNPYSLV